MNIQSKITNNAGNLARILILAFGGAALLLLVQSAFQPARGVTMSGYLQWLRDGTLALPLVAMAVLIAGRRATQRHGHGNGHGFVPNISFAALYAVAMGAGPLLRELFPEKAAYGGHNMGSGASTLTLTMLQQTLLSLVVAAAFALVVDMALHSLRSALGGSRFHLSPGWHMAGVIAVPAAMIGMTPLFNANSIALAQTSFPDQVIHPRVMLQMVARQMPDGSLAYVAPDYGAKGVRPTIEMMEGETLNITLKNELPFDVSLHVHGVLYSITSDGTRHSDTFVKPGEQRVYQWRAGKGTAGYWHYHDHVVGDDEGTGGIMGGLYGGLVVRRPGDPEPTKTFVLVMHDATINGRMSPNTPQPTAKQGELVEFLIISYGDTVHTFHLHAHRWLTPPRVAYPSMDLAANVGSGREDNRTISPGDSFGFLVRAGDEVGPGMWMYHCHFQSHASFMMGFFNVLPPGSQAKQH
jgi:FtsP/CotA-like multicopper oxidase with cupredoxin domain